MKKNGFTLHQTCLLPRPAATRRKSAGAGFTLLELVISVAIIAGIATVIAQTFFLTTRSNTKVEIEKEVKQNGDYALGIMERMIRSAQTITSACSASGTTLSALTFTNQDGGSTTFACDLSGGVTRIASTSALRTDYLTGSGVTLGATCVTSTLSFVCTSLTGLPASIKITFTLSQKSSSPDVVEKSTLPFQTIVTLRN